jgi:hypothetical protein
MKKAKKTRRKKSKGKNPGELVVLGLGNPKRRARSKKTVGKRRRNAGRNSLSEGKSLYERFHGKSPDEIREMHRETEARKDYVALGKLVAIGIDAQTFDSLGELKDITRWDSRPHLKFDSAKVLLASSPDGHQLYILGKEEQEIDLTQFETDTHKDFVDLGEATFVVYSANKAPDFQPTEWVHTFGEEGGERPRLAYDQFNRQLMLIGGSYHVDSPGIID